MADDLTEAKKNGYLYRYMYILVAPETGLPVYPGALPGDDLVKAKQQGYLHKHMVVRANPDTGIA